MCERTLPTFTDNGRQTLIADDRFVTSCPMRWNAIREIFGQVDEPPGNLRFYWRVLVQVMGVACGVTEGETLPKGLLAR